MKKILTALFLLCSLGAAAQETKGFDIDLWPNGLPNSNGIDKNSGVTYTSYQDTTWAFILNPNDGALQSKTMANSRHANQPAFKPSLRVFLPQGESKTDMAILILPGGGYRTLAFGHEGYQWADHFTRQGIATIVLTYRMPMGHTEVPISDATEAMRIVREKATAWGINPQKIGIMGSSAGGHLASTIATHSPAATRPNFQILFYPVISMDKEVTLPHRGAALARNGGPLQQCASGER